MPDRRPIWTTEAIGERIFSEVAWDFAKSKAFKEVRAFSRSSGLRYESWYYFPAHLLPWNRPRKKESANA